MIHSPDCGLGAVVRTDLTKDGFHVSLDGRFSDLEMSSDMLVRVTSDNPLKNSDLPHGQLLKDVRLAVGKRTPRGVMLYWRRQPQIQLHLGCDMSLVGPRPHALIHDAMYSKLIAAYVDRQAMRPGITGWAQVNGCRGETRGMTAMERRVQHDLQYICQWSLWLDVVILARTAVEILRDKNAC